MLQIFTEKYLNLLDPAGFVVEDKGTKKPLNDEEAAHGNPAASVDANGAAAADRSARNAASGDLDQVRMLGLHAPIHVVQCMHPLSAWVFAPCSWC